MTQIHADSMGPIWTQTKDGDAWVRAIHRKLIFEKLPKICVNLRESADPFPLCVFPR